MTLVLKLLVASVVALGGAGVVCAGGDTTKGISDVPGASTGSSSGNSNSLPNGATSPANKSSSEGVQSQGPQQAVTNQPSTGQNPSQSGAPGSTDPQQGGQGASDTTGTQSGKPAGGPAPSGT